MLLSPIKIKDQVIKNRIMLAPMCQYCATSDGFPTSWHYVHYVTRAVGGTGLVMVEATAIESRGRISNQDLGLWNDDQIEPLRQIASECKKHGASVGIQLAHAGRKCGVQSEEIVAPSSWNWSTEYKIPTELSHADIREVVMHFKISAKRAAEAGFDVLELHAAHGYLIHQFLSPLSNKRTDDYGGARENRVRFLLEIISAVREVWEEGRPLFLRVSADDYLEGGIDVQEMIEILRLVDKNKVDLIHVSTGGLLPANIDLYEGYQVKYADAIKRDLDYKTAAVGLITDPAYADEVLCKGQADMIALGRELLRSPYWPLNAIRSLKEDIEWPTQYKRAKPI